MAEDERKRIKERQEEGIKIAISKGAKSGRKKIGIDENFICVNKDWKEGKITAVEALRPITIEAWKRCKSLNVDPTNPNYIFLKEQVLLHKLEVKKDLIKIAKPYLEYLSLSLSGIPHVVALLDNEGWVIGIFGPL